MKIKQKFIYLPLKSSISPNSANKTLNVCKTALRLREKFLSKKGMLIIRENIHHLNFI